MSGDLVDLYGGILENPHEDAARLVYADAVEEAGDSVYAQFIRSQVQVESLIPTIDAANFHSNSDFATISFFHPQLPAGDGSAYGPIYRACRACFDSMDRIFEAPRMILDELEFGHSRQGYRLNIYIPSPELSPYGGPVKKSSLFPSFTVPGMNHSPATFVCCRGFFSAAVVSMSDLAEPSLALFMIKRLPITNVRIDVMNIESASCRFDLNNRLFVFDVCIRQLMIRFVVTNSEAILARSIVEMQSLIFIRMKHTILKHLNSVYPKIIFDINDHALNVLLETNGYVHMMNEAMVKPENRR